MSDPAPSQSHVVPLNQPPQQRFVPTQPAHGAPVGRPERLSGPQPNGDTNATRHLCAAAYEDEKFRELSLEEVYHQDKRLVAPSYGFDLITVLSHCLHANRIANLRDGLVLVIVALAAYLFPVDFIVAALVLVGWYLLVLGGRMVRAFSTGVADGRYANTNQILLRLVLSTGRFLFALVIIAIFLMVPLYFAIASQESDSSGQGPVTGPSYDEYGRPLPSGSVTGELSVPDPGAMTVVLLLILVAVPIVASVWRQRQVDRLEPGNHPGLPVITPRLGEIRQQEQGNTIVYSGYNPFVGSGYLAKTWRFAQRLLRSRDPGVAFGLTTEMDREFVEPPFTSRDVVDHLRRELVQLIDDPVAERRIPGLTVTDRVFLAGNEVTSLSPYTPEDRVLEVLRTPTAAARHYLVCQVVSWRGELVSTVYVHVAVQGRTLYLEFTAAALPPCDDRYRFVDMIGGTGRAAKVRAGLRGLVDAPRTISLALFNLLGRGWRAMTRAWSDFDLGRMRAGYDYGARMSVRELGTARDTRNHVQSQDILKHHRIIERRMLAAVLDFLDGRGVDTSEYRNQATNVLNAGFVMTGGILNNHGEMNVNQNNTAAPASGGGKG